MGIFSQEYIVVVQQNLQDMPSAISPIPPLLVIGASNTFSAFRRVQYFGSLKQRQCFRSHGLRVFFFRCANLVANFVNEIGGCHRTEHLRERVWIPWLCREKSYEKGFLISGNWMLFRNNKIRLERSMILCSIVSVPHGK